MGNLSNYRFTTSHEWITDNADGTVTIGISDHAQDLLGDVVFVELPEVGRTVEAGEEFSLVESVKAASDIYAPVSGEIIEVNNNLEDKPEVINSAPYLDGWIAKIKLADAAELEKLMPADIYSSSIEGAS